MFTKNIRAWKIENPSLQITDEIIEKCIRYKGGACEYSYKDLIYPHLKSLYDAQPQPKSKWQTFKNRVGKLEAMRELTDDDLTLLLQPQAKLNFFRGFLYRVTQKITGKYYIGISSQPLKERLRAHWRQAKCGDYKSPLSLQAALATYGPEGFIFEQLAEFDCVESLLLAEAKAIQDHNCLAPNGFNLRVGGLGWSKSGIDVWFEDFLYPSYSALAQAYGITEKLLDGRRRLGWSLEEALKTPALAKNACRRQFTVEDVEYESIKKISDAYGVHVNLIYDRLYMGWTIEDALGLTSRAEEAKTEVTVQGIVFKSTAEAARHHGKNPKEIYWKMARGKTIEQALGLLD